MFAKSNESATPVQIPKASRLAMDLAFARLRNAPRPRVQIFVSDLSATGVVRNAIAIANQACASGFDVRLLTCDSEGILRGELDEGVEVLSLLGPPGRYLGRNARHRSAVFAYRRLSREWSADILLSAGNHGHLLSSIAWLGLPGAKIIRISNDPGHFAAGTGWLKRFGRRLKFKVITALADRIILVSPSIAAHSHMFKAVESGKALLIRNGVDIDAVVRQAGEACPHPWLTDPRRQTVLAVGRSAPQKNFVTLVKAFAEARRVRDLRLVILGGGDRNALARLAALAADLGVSPFIDFVRPVANPFAYMARADAVALPSLWEGSSNVLLEALACGTPVVASRTAGDAVDVLDRGRFGVLVDPLDVTGLSDALLRQVSDRAIAPAGRARHFDRNRSLATYMALFNQIVAANHVPAAPTGTAEPVVSRPRAAA